MCATCGCGSQAKATLTNLQTGATMTLEHDHGHSHDHPHEHVHADGTRHSHSHDHGDPHDDDHGHDHTHHHHTNAETHAHVHNPGAPASVIELETRILAKNDALAARNRTWLEGREILALNLVSSPGAGKTSLLERTIHDLRGEFDLFVIEGDQETDADGARIRAAGAPAIQVNTGTGCHLDADMVARGLAELKPGPGAILMIENVGNLVCPALFDLGERAKVAILSVTEGDDKPAKYPHMFRAAQLMVLNKIDLLPYVDFDIARCVDHARAVKPDIEVLEVSSRSGEGLTSWYDWLRRQHRAVAAAPFEALGSQRTFAAPSL